MTPRLTQPSQSRGGRFRIICTHVVIGQRSSTNIQTTTQLSTQIDVWNFTLIVEHDGRWVFPYVHQASLHTSSIDNTLFCSTHSGFFPKFVKHRTVKNESLGLQYSRFGRKVNNALHYASFIKSPGIALGHEVRA